jgi:hypothetical protein
MEFLAVHGDMLAGAVIMMCGQNVGVGRGCAAGYVQLDPLNCLTTGQT